MSSKTISKREIYQLGIRVLSLYHHLGIRVLGLYHHLGIRVLGLYHHLGIRVLGFNNAQLIISDGFRAPKAL